MSWLLVLGLALFALHRTRGKAELERRIARLEQQVAALARRPEGPAALAPAATPSSEERIPGSAPPEALPAAPRPPPPATGPPPSAPRPPPPPRPPRPRPSLPTIDWERWIGVRGAAVLGGVVLALAGLYFFQYSIEHGLVPPWLRVLLGTLVGLGCVAGAELRARPRYAVLANGLVGGGIVVLYAASWGASVRYQLVGNQLGFALMIAVTAACTALAYRHASLVIAMIGLIGGFGTPMLLSTGEDRPIALFAYVLLLDAGLLFMARRRGWPSLALVSLLGTLFYQAAWIGGRMQPHQLALALAVLAIFAGVFAFSLRSLPAEARRAWLLTQGGAVLFPFVFALYLAATADFGEHFAPVAILLALLSASASWLGRVQKRAWLGLGAASGVTAVFAVWLAGTDLRGALAWEAMGLCVLLAGVFHLFVELDRELSGRQGPAPAAMLCALGLHALAVGAALANPGAGLWPWLAGWLGLTAFSLRHGGFARRGPLQAAAATLLGGGWWLFRWVHAGGPDLPRFAIDAGAVVAVAAAGQCLAMLRAEAVERRWGEHAAAVFSSLLLLSFAPVSQLAMPPIPVLATSALLGFFVLQSAARAPSGAWALAATVLTALVHSAWTAALPLLTDDAATALRALGVQLATAALFTAWPFVAFARLRGERLAWYGSALAGPAWFLSLRALYETALGGATIGLLAVALGALSLAAAWRASRIRAASDPRRTSNLAWYLAIALGFVTVAIPLQLEKEWITIGWALEGLAAIWLWRRLDHTGLKWFGLALLAGVTLRLVANEAVLGYYPRPAWRIVNWLLYTYLVPAAALVAAARVLAAHEVTRARSREWERRLYARSQAWGALAASLAAVLVVFVWINLAIADVFASGETLRLGFDRTPARDLTTSIAWALYALALLTLGVRGRSRGARWLSLGLMMGTVAKVFLYDLGQLEDLYRVASLLGLAVSLILISFAYQRFIVTRDVPSELGESR